MIAFPQSRSNSIRLGAFALLLASSATLFAQQTVVRPAASQSSVRVRPVAQPSGATTTVAAPPRTTSTPLVAQRYSTRPAPATRPTTTVRPSSQSAPVQQVSYPQRYTANGSAPRRYGFGTPSRPISQTTYIPRQFQTAEVVSEGEIIGGHEVISGPAHGGSVMIEGPMIHDEYSHDVEFEYGGSHHGGHCDSCSGGECGGECHQSCGGCCVQCCLIPCPKIGFLQVMVGTQGFKGPANRGGDSSFGFQSGVNIAGSLPCLSALGINYQLGGRGTASNLSGSAFITPQNRTQTFLTGGLFRRVDYGLQGGLVVDYLSDQWDFDVQLTQLRGEISWVFARGGEFGFAFAGTTRQQTANIAVAGNPAIPITGTDMYKFFWRQRFFEGRGAEVRIFGGFTGSSDAIVGGEGYFPIADRLALQADVFYKIPTETDVVAGGPFAGGGANPAVAAGAIGEAWNISFNLVFTPRARNAGLNSYSRPLFNVADNSTFVMDGLP